MCTIISFDKDKALKFAKTAHEATKYKVYTDGSGYKGGIGAVAVLYKGNRAIRLLQYHLGPKTNHTVYKSELTGILLALYLLTALRCCILSTIIIVLDNQAVIRSLNNQEHKPAHHLLDLIHTAVECLHSHQDHIQRHNEIQRARWRGLNPRSKPGVPVTYAYIGFLATTGLNPMTKLMGLQKMLLRVNPALELSSQNCFGK